jgi:hypothetical protein
MHNNIMQCKLALWYHTGFRHGGPGIKSQSNQMPIFIVPCGFHIVLYCTKNPSQRHFLFVSEGLRAVFEAESYDDGSVAACRFYHVRQVKA